MPLAGHPDERAGTRDEMRLVAASDDAPPQEEPADYSVSGSVLRLMWDYGVRVPLWDDEGLLPDEPDWLWTALGLSDSLIGDLTRWGLDMEDLDAVPSGKTTEAYEALNARARKLAERLQQELGSRYTVRYKPW